ncbi:MAG: metalloregulator ArsR/SmtB family transcription factor [Wenzhouxiangellaceae bacterium]|nr:metalloregulator ArsR/SmtB family transcription factor [Wenzhouxiangellaceae bacterium]
MIGRHCSLLGDSTRLRLLALLDHEELTVAELARITRLAQPRVSTHLARLREAGLVADRRDGVSVYYRSKTDDQSCELCQLWKLLSGCLDDPQVLVDAERLPDVIAERVSGRGWPDAVAGDMERHYSPGRTWEATTRALVQLISPGRVLDIASGDGIMGELLEHRATSIDCIDISPKVVQAGQARVADFENVRFHHGDMHALPFEDAVFDTVFLLHALTYSKQPEMAAAEAARVLAPGGKLVCAVLKQHRNSSQVEAYGHVNAGFEPEQLTALLETTGLAVDFCEITSVEKKPPNFEIITLLARRS